MTFVSQKCGSVRGGFTLIEVIVATVIGSYLMLMVGLTFAQLIKVRQRIISTTNIQKSVDQALLNMTQEAWWTEKINSLNSNRIDFQTDDQCFVYSLKPDAQGAYLEKYSATLTGASCSSVTNQTTERLTPPTTEVTEFKITNRSKGNNLDIPSLEVILTLESQVQNVSYSNKTAITPRNRFGQADTAPTPTP